MRIYKLFSKTEQNSNLMHFKRVYKLRNSKNNGISELEKLIKQRMGLK